MTATWIRVKDPTSGHERSTLVVAEGEQVLDKPAANRYGEPLPPKHNRPLSSIVAPDGRKVSEMRMPELLDYVATNGVLVDGESPRKDDILGAIVAHEGDDYGDPTDPPSDPPTESDTPAS